MGSIVGNGIHLNGNFAKVTKRRPKNWIDKDYKILVPYKFKWRDKIGNVECDCKECYELYRPWYGWTWTHHESCALMKHLSRHPNISNLIQYYGKDLSIITQTD